MFKPMTKSQLSKIADRIIALEKKKTRLLDILFEEDEIFAETILEQINDESFIRS